MQDHGAEADCVENKEAAPPAEDLGGRTTGDLAWREARGETGGGQAKAVAKKSADLPDGVARVQCARGMACWFECHPLGLAFSLAGLRNSEC